MTWGSLRNASTVVVLPLALGLSACGGSKAAAPTTTTLPPTTTTTRDPAAEKAKTAAAVLTLADLPGFKVDTSSNDTPDPTDACFATAVPSLDALDKEPSNTNGQDFTKGKDPNTTSVGSAAVYAATPEAATSTLADFRNAVTSVSTCLQTAFKTSIGDLPAGVTLDVKVLPSTATVTGADETAGLSLQIAISGGGSSFSGGGDFLVFRKGRVLANTNYISFGSASLGEAARLGAVVASRL